MLLYLIRIQCMQQFSTITHSTFRHWFVRFYASEGQPFSKQLYSTLFSVFEYFDETLSLVFDILIYKFKTQLLHFSLPSIIITTIIIITEQTLKKTTTTKMDPNLPITNHGCDLLNLSSELLFP